MRLLNFIGTPAPEVLGAGASDLRSPLARHGSVFVKPVFKGGVGKKARPASSGSPAILACGACRQGAPVLRTHEVDGVISKANGVTFEAAVPAQPELYFSITDSRISAPRR